MTEPHFFGIRHHGPGCARSLVRALEELRPDCLLIEGPPEGEDLLRFVADSGMEPPVALLVHCPDDPGLAAFYPYAEFSPEWQALRHGLAQGIPVRFIDLACAVDFALGKGVAGSAPESAPPTASDVDGAIPELAVEPAPEPLPAQRHDPLDWLGRAAGYGDGESWWNHMVEERGDGEGLFAAIREAMTALRGELPEPDPASPQGRRERLREAHMRKSLRQARKDGFERIAVVCGAWHVPALETMPPLKDDNALLKALPKVKTAAAWVPWSNGQLSYASGYGAGIEAPGWYEHLWRYPDRHRGMVAWFAKAAGLFRAEDLDCSSAHLVEAARLSETLAALRDRPSPGLDELAEALRTVVCLGDDTPMRLIQRRLIVGERLGRVPADAPAPPLQRDLEREQTRLRLKPEALQKTLDLDLRQPNDLARSRLLHRLNLLGIGWGRRQNQGYGAKGTFHEIWTLQWKPELALDVVAAGRFGNTVLEAATAKAMARTGDNPALAELALLVDEVLLADLPAAVDAVVAALEAQAAIAADAAQLLDALPPLANIVRYGDVRGTGAGLVRPVLDGMALRAAIGLSGACAALDDEAAENMQARIAQAHPAIRLAAGEEPQAAWLSALAGLARQDSGHGLVRGLAARLRFDERADDLDTTAKHLSQALSIGPEPAAAAAWLDGFLNQSALVLLHDDTLWRLVDAWVAELDETQFQRVLPLVRRTFAEFNPAERRQLGEKAAGGARRAAPVVAAEWDGRRAELPLPLLRTLLGLSA
ncbi:DUF5682 family protein [Methylomagnum ishizawai]|uniref:DUF5682 family protein n=1 Tax=Methylomagnum ishizawai TaxID=1760988 RepID=UPI001C31F560|nr:DUF5682 family protein [Methylomagnum ishizawai]BBL76989.1 hypothetical protein MishRS11D_40870 [Methylomagnum ishizawai]